MKIRVGVVGIGPLWDSRHLPALRALSDRFDVAAVCDPVQHRAQQAARQLNASVHDGFRALTARSDVDAVLLLSPQWFGPLPIYAACDEGKAIYCAAAIELKDNEAAVLRDRVREAGVAFMAEFPCRLSPATLRLKELIATRLGRPRLLFCNRRRTVAAAGEYGTKCELDMVELIDWCRYVVDAEPTSVVAVSHNRGDEECADYFSVSVDFSDGEDAEKGAMAMIACGEYVPKSCEESISYRRPADLKVVCDQGIAFVDLPNTVAWFDSAGQHLETLDHERPVGEQLLMHFHRAVESLVLKTASLDDAHRALTIASKARQSCALGQRVYC
ncbi:MAG: gfo/Idh/MocA family oxidoreductase [Planctomycetota bacterium]|nr:MAG: gfo/Idh/MocA family oxidoreductase [Planctomycetota bacterium]